MKKLLQHEEKCREDLIYVNTTPNRKGGRIIEKSLVYVNTTPNKGGTRCIIEKSLSPQGVRDDAKPIEHHLYRCSLIRQAAIPPRQTIDSCNNLSAIFCRCLLWIILSAANPVFKGQFGERTPCDQGTLSQNGVRCSLCQEIYDKGSPLK